MNRLHRILVVLEIQGLVDNQNFPCSLFFPCVSVSFLFVGTVKYLGLEPQSSAPHPLSPSCLMFLWAFPMSFWAFN